jgi:hypothetical protein
MAIVFTAIGSFMLGIAFHNPMLPVAVFFLVAAVIGTIEDK